MHKSIKLNSPCEFINITPVNPLISKCQIKVCYVGDEPNRNHSIITKEVAKEMANSLPGSPIVGFYNESKEDFEEHNRIIDISDGKFEIKETTRPYGFVDLGAKCWFQKFLDDDKDEREYLMTEGYLWTGQYPECQRVIDKGNNQSMELDDDSLDVSWSEGNKGTPEFFIINEAVISKLCILGEGNEPCFEGSSITKVSLEFSYSDGFKDELKRMMGELKNCLKGGTQRMFTVQDVSVGSPIWEAAATYMLNTYPAQEGADRCTKYGIAGFLTEDNNNFLIVKNYSDNKYYSLSYSFSEADGLSIGGEMAEATTEQVTSMFSQYSQEVMDSFSAEFKKKKADDEEKNSEDQTEQSETSENEETTEGEDEKSPEEEDESYACGGGSGGGASSGDSKKKRKKFGEENNEPNYDELAQQYDNLNTEYSKLKEANDAMSRQIEELTSFKNKIERSEKENMIDSFYMLSKEDKADVVKNIDLYSLDDIESKLSVICVRNKVSFDTETKHGPMTYNLSSQNSIVDDIPAWVKAALERQQKD